MHPIQMRLRRMNDEELAASCITPAMCHRDGACHMPVWIAIGLARDGISQIPGPIAAGTAALRDEARDHPVKSLSIIIAGLGQLDKVCHCDRRIFLI